MKFRNVFGHKALDVSERKRVAFKLNRFNDFMRRNSIWILIVIAMVLTIVNTRADSQRARENTEQLKKDNAEQTEILKEQTEQLKRGNERLKEIEHQNNCLLRIHIQGETDVEDCGPSPEPIPSTSSTPPEDPTSSPQNESPSSDSQNQNNNTNNGGSGEEETDIPIVPEVIENILGL